jgi:hypothetical protein
MPSDDEDSILGLNLTCAYVGACGEAPHLPLGHRFPRGGEKGLLRQLYRHRFKENLFQIHAGPLTIHH